MKFDELNILWINSMELTSEEKLLRIEMISNFERDINKVFDSQRSRIENESESKYLLYAAVYAAIMSASYVQQTNSYFKRYVQMITGGKSGISDYSKKWIEKRSQQFAKEVQETTQKFLEAGDYESAFSVSRAKSISRTEMNALCECATLEGYYQSGYNGKKWVSFKDSKVRTNHKDADGQIKGLFEPFDIGDSQLMFPQDGSLGASAKEIVNCRCVMQPVNIKL